MILIVPSVFLHGFQLQACAFSIPHLSTEENSLNLKQKITCYYGELHTAEFDWALTEENKERIRKLIMEEKRLPAFRQPVQRVSYRDGCKVYFENAWVIVRFSGTEARIRIFAEDDTIHHAKTLVGTMADFVGLPFDA